VSNGSGKRQVDRARHCFDDLTRESINVIEAVRIEYRLRCETMAAGILACAQLSGHGVWTAASFCVGAIGAR
jgi:hypothetical protein